MTKMLSSQNRTHINSRVEKTAESDLELLEVKTSSTAAHKTFLVLPKNPPYKIFIKNSKDLMAKQFDETDERYNSAKELLDELEYRHSLEDEERIFATCVITPDMASYFLFDRSENRPINETAVSKYAEIMWRGEWTPDTEIKFDKDGRLIDGQHRLAAIILANISVKLSILFGYGDKAQAVMDCGRARTAGDASKILGDNFSDTQYTLARTLFNNNQYKTVTSKDKANLVYGALTELVKRYQLGIDFALQPLRIKKEINNSVILSAVVRAFYREDNQRLKQFLYVLNSGLTSDIDKPDAALKLREAVIDARHKKISINSYIAQRQYHLLSLHAISLFCQKKNVKYLRFPVEGTVFQKYLLEYIDIKRVEND